MKLTPHQVSTANSFIEKAPVVSSDPRHDFISFLTSTGYENPKNFRIGDVTRVSAPNEKRSKKSGWFVYYEMDDTTEEGYSIGVAVYGDWRSDEPLRKWSSRSERQMSDKELRNYRAKMEVMKAQHDEEKRKRQNEAAERAFSIWDSLRDANKDHPYLVEKQVGVADGVKLTDQNELIIPAMIEEKIVTLQSIKANGNYEVGGNPIGNKKFMSGGRSKGSYFPIKGKNDIVYIAEGYSTGMSIHMATGKTVYVCFNCHNIYNVTAFVKDMHKDSIIIIAGDDDFKNEINAGRKYAEEAAMAHGVTSVFANGFNDFNDMHIEHGLEVIGRALMSDGRRYNSIKKVEKKDAGDGLSRPEGMLGHIFDYYNATSGNPQRGFAIQTAFAICATILGRSFKTDQNNYTSMFFINVGKTGTGKEHIKGTLEKVLDATGFGDRISGDGFTNGGAVQSALLRNPISTSCIDELGLYLEASAEGNKGNGNQREANTKIMEAFSKHGSTMRPLNYSTMSLTKSAQKDVENRIVHNPALTIMGITTPSTLFKNITMDAISNGFINRFLIYISDAQRVKRKFSPQIDVPEPIIEWSEKIRKRMGDTTHSCSEPANPTVIRFTDDAMRFIGEISQEKFEVEMPNALEKFGMSGLSLRSNEIVMRMSLMYALSRDPWTTQISRDDVEWCFNFVDLCLKKTIDMLKITVSSSEFEGHKKEILADIRGKRDGITWSQMQRTPPYSQHKSKYLKEILDALRDADLIDFEAHNPNGRGRPTTLWYAND